MDSHEPQPASSLPEKKEKWTSGDAYEIWMARWSRLLAAEFLPWLGVHAGMRWLDVCCGTGVLTQAILDNCRSASVVGVDRSPPQIEYARQHRASPQAEYQVADATALPFAEEDFDACVCGLGLNFISDSGLALREMKRVTRSGGTVAAYVWEYSGQTRFLREFWDAAIAVDPEAAQFDQGRRFPICTPEGLRAAFDDAIPGDVEVRPLDITTRFANFDDYWQPFLLGQGSGPTYLAARNETTRSAIRERLRASLPQNADGSIVLAARALAVGATRL